MNLKSFWIVPLFCCVIRAADYEKFPTPYRFESLQLADGRIYPNAIVKFHAAGQVYVESTKGSTWVWCIDLPVEVLARMGYDDVIKEKDARQTARDFEASQKAKGLINVNGEWREKSDWLDQESGKPGDHNVNLMNESEYSASNVEYSILSTENVGYARIIRKLVRVKVSKELTMESISKISREIIEAIKLKEHVDAISIAFYLPDTDTKGPYTAGDAVWAPGGEWGKEALDLPHQLNVVIGSAINWKPIPSDKIVNISVSRKRQIFVQIVRFQDQGMTNEESYSAAAKKFGVTSEEAKWIGLEGLTKNWPFP